MRRIVISVDVEAFPARQSAAHVDRLIWGRFGEKAAGIEQMMDIAERRDCAVTFFVDFCERFLHPGAMEEAAQRIVQRGHDLQLHAHPEFLSVGFWAKYGLQEWKTSLSGYTRERAEPLMDFLVESARGAGATPVAFRGGAFRFNHAVLGAMSRAGLPLSFNYNVKVNHQPNNETNRSIFAWNNGVIEVPAGNGDVQGVMRPFDINQMDLADRATVHPYLDGYFERFGDDAVLVLVMHSWSFCERNPATGHFELKDDRLMDSFDAFLSELPDGYCVRTATQLATELAAGTVRAEEVRDIELLDRDRHQTRASVAAAAAAGSQEQAPGPAQAPTSTAEISAPSAGATCNFCGTPARLMEDFGGRRGVRCPQCRSLERNRVLLWTYEQFIQHEFDLSGKRVLLVAPSDAEAAFFGQRSKATTCDVRPVAGFDLQLDICNMPEVADSSYDSVIAIAVLQHCHDDEAALDEIRRILTPGGRVFLHVSLRSNVGTEPVVDVTKHYGKDALEQYRVGTYRYYGDLPFLRSLQRRFLVKTFYGVDPVTQSHSVIFCGIKDPSA